jgi:transcriptional regulator with GAF, ATPase, and Fis domain
MNPRIIGVTGPFRDVVYVLPEGEVSLGRDSSNHLWFADASLSRRHCALVRKDGSVNLRDLGSRNGTRVNGVPVEEHPLQHGDEISIGASVLVFMSEEADDDAEGPAPEVLDTVEFKVIASALTDSDAAGSPFVDGSSRLPTPGESRHLSALLQLSNAIGRIRDIASLQWQLLGFIFDIVPATSAVLLRADSGGELTVATTWDRVRGPEHPVQPDSALVQRCLQERKAILDSESGGACVPLVAPEEILGAIYLQSNPQENSFGPHHLQLLTAVADIAALALRNLRHWEQLAHENQALRAEINLEHDMVGKSPAMRRVFDFIRRVAPADSTVLIQGESGTGKELVARAIHRNSARAAAPFVAINCAAITDTLLESELFGHEKGAFTGAIAQKRGKVESAQGGTLFLDEIGEMAIGLQAKLLRVLQEREFERVGGVRPIALDIRLVAATNRDLAAEAENGRFRRDLFYRLNVVRVSLPALRERSEDIEAMANHFVAKASRKSKVGPRTFSADALACMKAYDWPGNVRELENAVEHALVLGSSETIRPEDLPESLVDASASEAGDAASFHGSLKETKKQLILQAFKRADGNYIEAAKLLDIHPNSLLRLIRNLGLKELTKGVGGS